MTIEEKRRELFELDIHKQSARRNEIGEYVLPTIQDRWQGFNAALDTIEIELPSGCLDHPKDYWGGIADAKRAVESLNLRIKIK